MFNHHHFLQHQAFFAEDQQSVPLIPLIPLIPFIPFFPDDQQVVEEEQARQPAAAVAAIEAMPDVSVTASDLERECNECVICLEKMAVGDAALRIPCGHLFHKECLRTWLASSNQCPVCRYELPTEDPAYDIGRHERMMARRPRLRLEDLAMKSVRELRYLAQSLHVGIVGCLEKRDLVNALVQSGAVEIIPGSQETESTAMHEEGIQSLRCTPSEDGRTGEDPDTEQLSASPHHVAPAASFESMDIEVGDQVASGDDDSMQVDLTGAGILSVASSSQHDGTEEVSTPSCDSANRHISRCNAAFLTTRSVRELIFLANHMGVSVDSCVDKQDLVDTIARACPTSIAAVIREIARNSASFVPALTAPAVEANLPLNIEYATHAHF